MTKDSNNQNKKTILFAHHFRAIELRYMGKKYKEITATLQEEFKRDFKEQTVRYWFSKNGQLDELYLDFAIKENKRRKQHLREELKKLGAKIPEKFQALMNRPEVDILTLRTIKELCVVLGFKFDDGDDDKEDLLDQYFERAEEEIKKQEQDQKNAAANTNNVNKEVAPPGTLPVPNKD